MQNRNGNSFNPDEWIKVQGVPVKKWEVVQFEQKFGGMLFDESAFDTKAKKDACANIIRELNHRLRVIQELKGDPEHLPTSVDIGDKFWLYIPVGFTMNTPRTKKNPAGLVGWFRIKKLIRV